MNSKVTIVIPVYNTKQYLVKCVESITNQTYKNLEILLVDDGSTDGSAEVCDKLAKTDARIKVIHKENGGAGTARNLGIDIASGKYIMFLDSDDWLDIYAIENVVQHAEENDIDVVRFGYVRDFGNKQLIKKNTFLENKIYQEDECLTIRRRILGLVEEELSHPENMNYLASCGFNLYKKELLRKSGVRFISIKEVGSFVDGLFNFCVFADVRKFEFIDKPYYHYRKTNETAATAKYRSNYVERQIHLFELLKSEIDKREQWDIFEEAYNNRVVLSTMEMAFNTMRNRKSFKERYQEIDSILKHQQFRIAYNNFSLKHMGVKWKIYYFFIKHSMTFPVYFMTKIIVQLKNRGTV